MASDSACSPSSVCGEPVAIQVGLADPSRVKKRLSPDAARRVFATLAVVAVVLLILAIGLIAWVVLNRAPS